MAATAKQSRAIASHQHRGKVRTQYDPQNWQDRFELISQVLGRILECFGEDIEQGDFPSYNLFVKHKELFSASLSYKNLSGEQMVTIFTRKFFTNRSQFRRMLEYFIHTPDKMAFEEKVKCLIEEGTRNANKGANPLPQFGWGSHLVFSREEQKAVDFSLCYRMMQIYEIQQKQQAHVIRK